MLDQNFYKQIELIVRSELSCSAHDMSHVMRVYANACYLAAFEPKADMDVIKTAALLHDIARVKEDKDTSGKTDHAVLGAQMAEEILQSFECDPYFIKRVSLAIRRHRFKAQNEPESIEEKILFDADKLDVIGAVGIARSYMLAGQYGQQVYNDVNLDDYVKSNLFGGDSHGRIMDMQKHAPNIEFELKLKQVPQKLYTERAKRLASKRFAFMEMFFEVLRDETVTAAATDR